MLTRTQKSLLAILRTIQTEGPVDTGSGICYNVDCYQRARHAIGVDTRVGEFDPGYALSDLFRKFGLCRSYPVQCGEDEDPEVLYYSTFDKWDKHTQYGRNRWALLDRCIKHLVDLE